MATRIAKEYWIEHIYFIELAPGYALKGNRLHHIARLSKEEAHAAMWRVGRCACATCRILSRPAAQRVAS